MIGHIALNQNGEIIAADHESDWLPLASARKDLPNRTNHPEADDEAAAWIRGRYCR